MIKSYLYIFPAVLEYYFHNYYLYFFVIGSETRFITGFGLLVPDPDYWYRIRITGTGKDYWYRIRITGTG